MKVITLLVSTCKIHNNNKTQQPPWCVLLLLFSVRELTRSVITL